MDELIDDNVLIDKWIKDYLRYCLDCHEHKSAREVMQCVRDALTDFIDDKPVDWWTGVTELPWGEIAWTCRVGYHKQCLGCGCSCHLKKDGDDEHE